MQLAAGATTLAGSEAGVAKSKFGSVYTVATAAAVSEASAVTRGKSSAALPTYALQPSLMVGLVTVVGSALFGAAITL